MLEANEIKELEELRANFIVLKNDHIDLQSRYNTLISLNNRYITFVNKINDIKTRLVSILEEVPIIKT